MTNKKKRVERTGPGGDMLEDIAAATAAAFTRKHAPECCRDYHGVCHPDCETDAQLRARIVERFG